jgi:hypothetical protein
MGSVYFMEQLSNLFIITKFNNRTFPVEFCFEVILKKRKEKRCKKMKRCAFPVTHGRGDVWG